MKKQLLSLRQRMREAQVDAYLIPTTDFHGSEYVNDYFKCRRYISGFTGSAGTLLVTGDDAWLWTDGRYFIQAEEQLAGTGIRLMKEQTPGVPTLIEHLAALAKAQKDFRLGFDGRVVNAVMGEELSEICQISHELDLVGDIWADRPAIQPSPIYSLPLSVTGETAESKLARLRAQMTALGADCHLITSLEEIAWLFNLRGNDVANTPVFFAFALITSEDARLYVMDTGLKHSAQTDSDDQTQQDEPLLPECVNALPYLQIFDDLKTLDAQACLLDPKVVSYSLLQSLPDAVTCVRRPDPVVLMKALKNSAEIACTKAAHLRDGAAMVQFLCWLKANIGKAPISELSAADYLAECRRAQPGFKDLSFSTIAGYGPHGAIVHYDPTPESNSALEPSGFLLVDSGGQYEDGTTDITRTVALGPLTEVMRTHYTLVLRAHIALARASFPVGTTGTALDAIARKPLQDAGLDYAHGTGHGVGHLLSVHEGPQRISVAGSHQPFYPGMITSNEPGVYIEGSHGIRLENEILCVETENGGCAFETITFCPFDREAIDATLLTVDELNWLNTYHQKVRAAILPLVDGATGKWLVEATEEIKK